MELGLLASAAAILLKESFPHVCGLAGDAATAALKKVAGEKGKEWAEALGLLKKKVEEDPVAGALVGVLDREDGLESFRDHLRKVLERDDVLRSELGARLSVTEAGDGGLANAGTLNAAQVATGGGNTQLSIGTVIVAVGGSGSSSSSPLPVPQDHRDDYLRWVLKQTATVPLGGVDPSVATSDKHRHLQLAGVYTALRTTTPRDPKEQLSDFESAKHAHLKEKNKPPIPALEQLDNHPKLTLLGQPGGGKSTFVNFVAHCLAGEALGNPYANLERLTAPLPEDDGTDGEERQSFTHTDLLPIRIILRDVAAKVTKPEGEIGAQDLLDFVLDDLGEAALAPCRQLVEQALREGKALVLLDGLDEVPEARSRRKVICRLVESFVDTFSECRFVVTARTYAYQHQDFRLKDFETVELAPFGAGQIRRFVRRWYEQVAEQGKLKGEDAKGRAVLLERAIFSSDRLRDFAERPLLLTLMASLHSWRGGSLPRDRQRLYSDTVELLLDVWEGQRREKDAEGNFLLPEPSLTEWLKIERDEVLRLLCELAYKAHSEQPEAVGTADIPAGDLVNRLRLRGQNAEQVNPGLLADYLSKRAGILEERGDQVYTFPHRTFQEYLTACHLANTDDAVDQLAALGRKDPNRWREVVLLAAPMLKAWGTLALVDSLAFEGPRSEPQEVAWGLRLAGQALAESLNLENVNDQNRKRLDDIRHRMTDLLHSPHLPATERALAGDHLGKLGDPRFAEEPPHLPTDEMAGFVFVPGGSYIMGSKESDLESFKEEQRAFEHFHSTELPQHSVELTDFFIARFPVTEFQFHAYRTADKTKEDQALRNGTHRPVVHVSWDDAMAYCDWLTQRLRAMAPSFASSASSPEAVEMWRALATGDLRVQLPSEAQWEAAARGADGRSHPWGDVEPTPEHANYWGSGLGSPSPVGIYGMGRGPFDAEDQAGNVFEWCLDAWDEKAYTKRDGAKDPLCRNDNTESRVCRGGSWLVVPWDLRAACRYWYWSGSRSDSVGFRVLLCRFPEP